jgi:hypothetical protein
MRNKRPKRCLKRNENLGKRTPRSGVIDVTPDSRAELFAQGELLKTFSLGPAYGKSIRSPVDVGQQKIRSFAPSQTIRGKEQ